MRAWQNVRRFKGRSRFYTRLTRIGVNEAYRELNRSSLEIVELEDWLGERVPAWAPAPTSCSSRASSLSPRRMLRLRRQACP